VKFIKRKVLRPVYAAIKKISIQDLLIVGGVAGLGIGIWWIFPPASLITIGILALLIGIRGSL